MPPPKPLPPTEFIAFEALYFSVIFLLCFILYYKLREVYKITDYKGFYFFSNTFLFLGVAYFLRSVTFLLFTSGVLLDELSFEGVRGLMLFSVAFLAYSGSVAILYNIYSLLWRWLEKIPSEALIHIIAVLIALISIIARSPLAFVTSQLILTLFLLMAIFINYRHYKFDGKVKRAYPLYILLFVFWLLNLSLALLLLPIEWRFTIYGLSVAVLLVIAYRVLKKL
ncbi:MAG: hypothetical protein H0Z19_06615 [Archaeoglobus sp.]|uniref:hypothetical protein n=1 Tax=Archaeoglobus sp. TaxID=1872626 RepID=UPI001D2C499A|nr:hypothetical protein [Archaeoglobus sp.]MBO8180139.1 hypothetical protein [Archaeoglobus sp.]